MSFATGFALSFRGKPAVADDIAEPSDDDIPKGFVMGLLLGALFWAVLLWRWARG